jgi:NADH-quinone oxidoreductase subunit L
MILPLSFFVLIPLVGLLLSLIPRNHQEKPLILIVEATVLAHAFLGIYTTWYWLSHDMIPLSQQWLTIYHDGDSHFSIDFFYDKVTIFYGTIATILTFFVARFSRFYIHREPGFKRFFNNMLCFYLGINIIIFAGNLETLFIGWEIIGITSYLLIGFYRDRYLPVKNAIKVLSLYRIADIALLLSIWLTHHFFHKSVSFYALDQMTEIHTWFGEHPYFQGIVAGLFLLVAMVKSAQFPFSWWLPRAMEGPTASSAIFYGSLSVHIGVMLLIRVHPIWEGNLWFQALVFSIGLLTAILASFTAQVQPTVKTQIAYSSIAQIGIMFMEVALGWYTLALVHFACNAFLRTYQLLVSPSVLSYLVHDQFFNFQKPDNRLKTGLRDKWRATIYVLAVKEWNIDMFMYNTFWKPLKSAGRALRFFNTPVSIGLAVLAYLCSLYLIYHHHLVPEWLSSAMPLAWATIAGIVILMAFVERVSAEKSLALAIFNQFCIAMSVAWNEEFQFSLIHLYLSGIVICGAVAWLVLRRLAARESVGLDKFYGHAYEYPMLALIFLLACMGLSGFPITPTFIGEDLLISHIHPNQLSLAALIVFSLFLSGMTVYRIHARVFLGPHCKAYHEIALRSA